MTTPGTRYTVVRDTLVELPPPGLVPRDNIPLEFKPSKSLTRDMLKGIYDDYELAYHQGATTIQEAWEQARIDAVKQIEDAAATLRAAEHGLRFSSARGTNGIYYNVLPNWVDLPLPHWQITVTKRSDGAYFVSQTGTALKASGEEEK